MKLLWENSFSSPQGRIIISLSRKGKTQSIIHASTNAAPQQVIAVVSGAKRRSRMSQTENENWKSQGDNRPKQQAEHRHHRRLVEENEIQRDVTNLKEVAHIPLKTAGNG